MATEKHPTGMLLDGVFASEAIDSSGETISIKGMDISTFDEGKGLANWEHLSAEEGKGFGQEIVGKIVYARKIFNEDDCLDDRQKLFWKRTKLPFLYGVVRLYDGAGHDGAKALAASIRDSVANDEPVVIGFSIEGATLERDGNKLKSTIARLVALTTKSCNKQSVSGILSDPNAPEGYDTNPENAKTVLKTVVDPMNMRLGGSETEYGVDMLKALSAGSYNAAPGALTGGAALQREDRTLHAVAKAAARDWPKTGKFREFLKKELDKAELGDVSEDFLDHYSDLVESKYYRVKKSEEVIAALKKAGKYVYDKATKTSVLKDKPEAKTTAVERIRSQQPGGIKAAPKGGLTNNGVAVPTNPKLTEPHFDTTNGILHMPEGSFKVYVPGRDTPELARHFHDILNDPKVEKFHGYAMQNWAKAHRLMKAGKLPPEVTMHATLFSNMSPNTPVPVQELMYGHLVDAMKDTGENPLTPGWDSVKSNWTDRDDPDTFPDHSPQHWKRLKNALRLKHDSKLTGRKVGEVAGFQMANNKFDNMSKYKDMHDPLVELVQRHKGDGRAMAEEMMHHKYEKVKWENRRRLGIEAGREDIGKYPGLPIAGLAPKTARYALAMMGAGNIHVPDTHFTRNLFGLNREQDGNSIERIKKVLWNPKNTHILNGIDQYYAANHDAVRHMLEHPKWGGVFEKPEDAIFPAFWKHWMAIVPHEQARGHEVNGYNELTDHRPFWEAVSPYLGKAEDTNLPLQTAKQHAEWQLQYGEMPAMMLYYRHLLPRLLANAGAREAEPLVRAVQELQVELLAKAGEDPSESPTTPAGQNNTAHSAANYANVLAGERVKHGLPSHTKYMAVKAAIDRGIPDRPVVFQNKEVKPGLAINNDTGEEFHLLGHTPTHFFALPGQMRPHEGWTEKDILKIPRNYSKGRFEVQSYPESVGEPLVVNADRHGVPGFVDTPEARALAHGFDFGLKTAGGSGGAFAATSFWSKDPRGNHVYVKGASSGPEAVHEHTAGEGPWNTARKEGVYSNIARDVFGLGHMVPNVAVVSHPATGQEHAIISAWPGAQHYHDLNPRDAGQHLAAANQNGDVHKAAMMNFVLDNIDRHHGNYMFAKDAAGKPQLALIDHNIWGTPPSRKDGLWRSNPAYLSPLRQTKIGSPEHNAYTGVHPEAVQWVQKLDPAALRDHLMKYSAPPATIARAVFRLTNLKGHLASSVPSGGLDTVFHRAALGPPATYQKLGQ